MKTITLDTLRGFRFLALVTGFLIAFLALAAGFLITATVIGAALLSLSSVVSTLVANINVGVLVFSAVVVSVVALSTLIGARIRDDEARFA